MARHLELEMQSELSIDYVKAVAGIFQASGYFGERTVDQLATLIFVGDALGLKPANAVFDLEVKDGAIQYKPAEAFRAAADQVDGLKASIEAVEPDTTVWCTFGRKEPGGGERCETQVACRAVCQKANRASLEAEGQNVVTALTNSRNKGPLPFQKAERPLDGPQAGKHEPGQQEPAKRADLSDSDTAEPASRPEKVKETAENADIATPGPASAAATIGELRDEIREALSEDGRRTLAESKGFCIYAGVSTNIYKWTLDEARKAHAALKPFLESR